MNKQERAEKEHEKVEAKERLLSMINPGDTIYTILRRKSTNGMNRDISLVIVDRMDMTIFDITWLAASVLGYAVNRDNGGIRCSGCGMDMGWNLVYSLGSRLWTDGTEKAHGARNGEPDFSGGYALKHQWL